MRTAKCVFRSSASYSLVFPLGIDYAAAGEDPTQITLWVRLTHTSVSPYAAWYSRWESNPDRLFRKQLFYPLNYGNENQMRRT